MTVLINQPIKRFFAFGCSFTKYAWTTWPEIIAEDLNIDEFYNLGRSGAGNEFIFNQLMQADQIYDFNEDDLIIICWTNVIREDRFLNGQWKTAGNIYTQKVYSKHIVKELYNNPDDLILHDYAFIKASRILLEHKKTNWHFLQMLDTFAILDQYNFNNNIKSKFSHLTDVEKSFIKPSFYEILWNNDIQIKITKTCETFPKLTFYDSHPSPLEHFQYLTAIFNNHRWKKLTEVKINLLEKFYRKKMSELKSDVYNRDNKEYFDHLRISKNISFLIF